MAGASLHQFDARTAKIVAEICVHNGQPSTAHKKIGFSKCDLWHILDYVRILWWIENYFPPDCSMEVLLFVEWMGRVKDPPLITSDFPPNDLVLFHDEWP